MGRCGVSDGTTAVPMSLVVAEDGSRRRALCPSCIGGRLHPYKIQIDLGGFEGISHLTGWVAVCAGSRADLGESQVDLPACGFSTPLTPDRAT